VHLQETGTPELLAASLELLELLLAEFPEKTELAQAHQQRAECLATLGQKEQAIDAYRAALAAERHLPNVRTNAYLGFGELVVELDRKDLYEEVLSVLQEFGGSEAFPIEEYRFNVIRALISDARGLEEARRYAQLALTAASKTQSPFRYHRTLGLVGEQKRDVEARLAKLASKVH
jgi:tetratricopeptide (TPR) repeat protein